MERFLDKITLGDCYDLIKQLPDKSVDLIVTDPPLRFGNRRKQRKQYKQKF